MFKALNRLVNLHFRVKMSDRKAELERKREKLRQIRLEKERKMREKEQADAK